MRLTHLDQILDELEVFVVIGQKYRFVDNRSRRDYEISRASTRIRSTTRDCSLQLTEDPSNPIVEWKSVEVGFDERKLRSAACALVGIGCD